MRGRFGHFMDGRYGQDELNRALSTISLICIIINLFVKNQILWYVAVILLVVIYFRMLSRNIGKRSAENDRFLDFTDRFRRGGGYQRGSRRGRSSYNSYDSRRENNSYDSRRGFGEEQRARAAKKKREWEQRKTYRFFSCPQCEQRVRVPKGKGRIEITCPKCRTSFVKKS